MPEIQTEADFAEKTQCAVCERKSYRLGIASRCINRQRNKAACTGVSDPEDRLTVPVAGQFREQPLAEAKHITDGDRELRA